MNNVAVAKRAYSYYDKSSEERRPEDFGEFFDTLAEDVVFSGTYPPGTPISGEFCGKQAVMNYFADHADLVEGWESNAPLNFIDAGDRVVVLGTQTYKVKKSGAVIRDREFATVLSFRDGLIAKILVIKDVSEFAEAYLCG